MNIVGIIKNWAFMIFLAALNLAVVILVVIFNLGFDLSLIVPLASIFSAFATVGATITALYLGFGRRAKLTIDNETFVEEWERAQNPYITIRVKVRNESRYSAKSCEAKLEVYDLSKQRILHRMLH